MEAYKADIKAQLTRAGLIRGQPRSSIIQATTASSSVFTTQHYQAPSTSQIPNDPPSLIFADSFPTAEPSTVLSPYRMHPSSRPPHHTTEPPNPASSNSPFDFPLQFDPAFPHLNTHSPFTPSTSIPSSHPSPHDIPQFAPTFDGPASSPTTFSADMTLSALPGQSMQTDHVLYYFEHVCALQFAFAETSVKNITYSVRSSVPQSGALPDSRHPPLARVAEPPWLPHRRSLRPRKSPSRMYLYWQTRTQCRREFTSTHVLR